MGEAMLERVARALWNDASIRATGRPRRSEWADESEETRETWRHGARAAIEAMREPTEEMCGIEMLSHFDGEYGDYNVYFESGQLRKVWTAMIDVILSPPAEEGRNG